MLGSLEALIRLHELSTTNGSDPSMASERVTVEVQRCKVELSPELVDRHRYLVSRYGTSAVVPIKAGCCAGCFIQIPTARRNQLEKGIYVCEQCGRLLYEPAMAYDLVDAV